MSHSLAMFKQTSFPAGLLLLFFVFISPTKADSPSTSRPPYSDAVVAKADKIIEDAGLQRLGKSISSEVLAELSRKASQLKRSSKSMRVSQREWQQAHARHQANRYERRQLMVQAGEWSLELARPLLTTRRNNQLVGLVNAAKAKIELLDEQAKSLQSAADSKRSALNELETNYAEGAIEIREALDQHQADLAKRLSDSKVQTAIGVYSVNFGVDRNVTPKTIVSSLDRRLKSIEQGIFSETINLRRQGNSFYATVSVNGKSTEMIVDSGAEMISLPMHLAGKLGIVVPSDAPEMRMIMADGSEIPAKRVTLGKVRIGEFAAENVDAAILDIQAVRAEPLLGMSFLGRFKFELDASASSLKMLRVE
ncbi:MAG: TIGR02281 family clan AA aspartic protease [Planctomycetota bacterium]